MNLTTGFIHHFCANAWSMAKIGLLSRIEKAISRVEQADVVERDDGVGTGFGDVLDAL